MAGKSGFGASYEGHGRAFLHAIEETERRADRVEQLIRRGSCRKVLLPLVEAFEEFGRVDAHWISAPPPEVSRALEPRRRRVLRRLTAARQTVARCMPFWPGGGDQG